MNVTGYCRGFCSSFALCVLPLCSSLASGGEALYNGIVLPSPWPPSITGLDRTPTTPYYIASPPTVIPIDVGRQLFVDGFLVEDTTLAQRFHPATVHTQPVLVPDKPWESMGNGAPTAMPYSDGVWFDPKDNFYKMWYMAGYCTSTAYARSTDGIHWVKPILNVVPDTNIVSLGDRDSATIWLDQRTTTDSSQRYKMMCCNSNTTLHDVRYSADGIHWGDVLARSTQTTGDRTTMFYNPFRDKWVLSLRTYLDSPMGRVRAYAEGTTLVNATQAAPTWWVGADALDVPRPEIGTTTELYNLDGVGYESVMAGLFTIWHGNPSNPGRGKINNVSVGFSRDGFSWDRSDRVPLVDVSEDSRAWNYSNVQSAGGGFLVVGDQLYSYNSGRQPTANSTGLSTIRRDGFASMDAGQAPGTLTTRPVQFSGKYLFVNTDAVGGQLQAEVLNQNGNVIAPYSRQNCVAMSGDSTCARISWNGASDLSALAGQAVKFRFYLADGSLYSFWVSPDQSGASYGYVGAGGPGFTGPIDTVGRATGTQISLKAAADTTNAGYAGQAAIGATGVAHDCVDLPMRFDLSEQNGHLAIGNGTLTVRQVPGQLPVNFDGETLDLYAMPVNSPDPTAEMRLIDSIVWSDRLGTDSAVFTIPNGDLNQWLGNGGASLMLRSDSAETLLRGGDLAQRTWYAATLETDSGDFGPTLSFVCVPEAATICQVFSGLLFAGIWVAIRKTPRRSSC
jgi:hypothetical protein